MEDIIIGRNITKSFNSKPVLDNVSFHLRKGENVVLLGRSGAGKSVLLKMIVGLTEVDHGELKVLNRDITKLNLNGWIDLRKQIGYLFQEGALYDSMTVWENVAFPLKRQVRKISFKEIDSRVRKALSKVGLEETVGKMPDELSGGMKKRIALARALILEPQIILYDEPTAGLDPVTAREIVTLINEMRDTLGISAIIATHDVICVNMAADRIMVIHQGKIYNGDSISYMSKNIPWIRDFFVSYEEK